MTSEAEEQPQGLTPKEEAADLRENPLPEEQDPCLTCTHCVREELVCGLDADQECTYQSLDDLPPLERIYYLEQERKRLETTLATVTKMRDERIAAAVEAGTTEEGDFQLINKQRKVRAVKVDEFKAQFPEAYRTLHNAAIDAAMKKVQDVTVSDLVTISVKEAEELVGKKPLSNVCTEQVYDHWSIVLVEG